LIVVSECAITVWDMATEITVRGSFSAFHPAERGTAFVVVGYEGPEMDPVYQRVARELEEVKSSAAALKKKGAVTWWSAESSYAPGPTGRGTRTASYCRWCTTPAWTWR
jgi:hypothetical protein